MMYFYQKKTIMENKLNEETLKRIDNIKIPADLEALEVEFIPLRNDVLLKEAKQGERKLKAGGIDLIVPEFNGVSQPIGRIVALGPQCVPYLKKGQLVMYHAMQAMDIVISGVNYIIVNDLSGIRGIIADEMKVKVEANKPPTKAELDRAERTDRAVRVRKDNAVNFDNHMDGYHEKLKDKRKNPITSKYKGQ
jgi:co-chaperonin GroES (HSP10)